MTYTFYIDEAAEIATLNEMLSDGGGCSVLERANQYNIPVEIAQKCKSEKIPSELTDFVHREYVKSKSTLYEAIKYHQNYWDGVGQKHLKKISKIMGQKIPHFRVRLDLFCTGTSDWYGTDISIKAFEYKYNPSVWYSTILWETILAMTFQKIRQKYPSEKFSDNVLWMVSEMTSCAIINSEFPIVWRIGYPQLLPHQEQVIQFYKNKKTFSDFLEKLLGYFSSLDIKNPF